MIFFDKFITTIEKKLLDIYKGNVFLLATYSISSEITKKKTKLLKWEKKKLNNFLRLKQLNFLSTFNTFLNPFNFCLSFAYAVECFSAKK